MRFKRKIEKHLARFTLLNDLGKMCSTTGSNASVKTMTRYLDEIYKWAYINQIPLITPDELKWVRN